MEFFWQGVGPGLISGGLMVLLGRLWRFGERDVGWASSLAVGVGAGAGYVLIRDWPGWWPRESTAVVPFAAVLAGVVGMVCARWLRGWIWGLVGAMGVGFGAFWLVTRNLRAYSWGTGEAVCWLAGLTFGVGMLWLCMRGQVGRWGGRTFAVAYGLFSAVMGGVLVLSGSAALGQLSGGLAAGVGGVFVATCWRRGVSWADGVVTVLAVVVGVLLACGYLFAEMDWYVGLMVLGGPLLGFVSEVAWVRGLGGWKLFFVRVGLVLCPVVGGLVLAFIGYSLD